MNKVWDQDAERAVLGAILINEEECWAEGVHTTLAPEDFFDQLHSAVYSAMLALHTRNTPVTGITVADELDRKGRREWADKQVAPKEIVGWLFERAFYTLASYGVIAHARMVKDYSERRKIFEAKKEAAQRAADATDALPIYRRAEYAGADF